MPTPLLQRCLLEVLLEASAWRIIHSQCPRTVEPVADARHREWMTENTHRHQHVEVLYVLGGTGRHGYCGEVYPFGPGTVFYFGPREPHDVEVPHWAPDAELLWVTLMGPRFLARHLSFRRELPAGRGQLGHLLVAEDSGLLAGNPLAGPPQPALPPRARSLQVRAGLELLAAAIVSHQEAPAEDEPLRRRAVRMIERYLHDSAGRDTGVAELARMAGYSPYHFMRLFRQVTGRTVQEYIDQCREARVRELTEQGWRQYEIAEHLGFSCAASFSRWYRSRRPSACSQGGEGPRGRR